MIVNYVPKLQREDSIVSLKCKEKWHIMRKKTWNCLARYGRISKKT